MFITEAKLPKRKIWRKWREPQTRKKFQLTKTMMMKMRKLKVKILCKNLVIKDNGQLQQSGRKLQESGRMELQESSRGGGGVEVRSLEWGSVRGWGRELGVWEEQVAGGWGDVRRVAGKSCRMVEDVSLARKSCLRPCIQSFRKFIIFFVFF